MRCSFFCQVFLFFLRAFACGVPPVVIFFVCTVFFCVWQVCSVRFPVVRRGTGVCLSVFWVAAAVSAGVRCGIRASEALFCRERENLLGTSADGSASHRSGAGCLRVWSAGLCGRQLFDPVVVAWRDQVLFWVINLPVAEGLFKKQVRLHPKMIVFKIQCIIKFATIVIYDHLMRQSGLKYDNLD